MLLLECLLGRILLILLSIFPADVIDKHCLIHEEFYMQSLNVALKNLHSRFLSKELLDEITKYFKTFDCSSIWLVLHSLTSKIEVFLAKEVLRHEHAVVELNMLSVFLPEFEQTQQITAPLSSSV